MKITKEEKLKKLRSARAKFNHKIRKLANPKAYSEAQKNAAKMSQKRRK